MNKIINVFLEAVAAVNPKKLIKENLCLIGNDLLVCNKVYHLNDGKLYLIGFGKAVLFMASQVEKILGNRLSNGVICVPVNSQDTEEPTLKENSVIEVYEGAYNNLPDEKALRGTEAIINLVKSLNKETDSLLVLISGGGSALFTKPKDGVTIKNKLQIINKLSSNGANITELNTVRKKLSTVKGGNLALLTYPAKTIALILSDVLHDSLDIVASGPTFPNLDFEYAAYEILKKYYLLDTIPERIVNIIKEPNSKIPFSLIDDNKFPHVDNYLIGNNKKALTSAKAYSDNHGLKSTILSSELIGNVQCIADIYQELIISIIDIIQCANNESFLKIEKFSKNVSFALNENFVNEIKQLITNDLPLLKNICIMAGGETTVFKKGKGKGGRNQELALIMSLKIHQVKLKYHEFFKNYDVQFLSAGTDGIDGPTNAAGAIINANVIDEAEKSNLCVMEYLENNDSHNFFLKLKNGSNLIFTGHTGTNVSDIHILSFSLNS